MRDRIAKARAWFAMKRKAAWKAVKPVLLHPLSYVLGLGVLGAASIVTGVFLYQGPAAAFICAGVFMILGARYVSKGMTNG